MFRRALLLSTIALCGTVQAIAPNDLATFVDGFMEARMAEHGVVGATVSVVHDGRVIFAKGYGHDDLEAGRLVEAGRSLFRPGSISKTLTWTAAMQLHERGDLDLEADIQTYLPDLELPRTFGKPITMLDLMAHQPGLEDSAVGHLFVEDPESTQTLEEYLAGHQPKQVREPGTLASYSNYGSGLAGLIVANLSGQTFEDYVDEHITGPLGMTRTTFREPGMADHRAMDEALAADVSKGYIRLGGALHHTDFVYIGQVAPAGGLSTTATDMAIWMLAHLGGGEYEGARILSAETAARMHSQHRTLHPALPGMAHGFIEVDVHGYRGYGHGGGTVHFLSDLVMLPDLDLGIFVSTNTTEAGGKLIAQLPRVLVSRYFPAGPNILPPDKDADIDTSHLVGNYIFTRRSYSQIEKLNMPVVAVGAAEGNRISFGEPARAYEHVGDGVFQQLHNPDQKIAFYGEEGAPAAGFYPPMAIMVAERASVLDTPQGVFGWLGFAALVFACVLAGAFLRRKRTPPQTTGERRAAVAVYLTATGWLAAIIGISVSFGQILSDFRNVFFAFPPPMLVASLTIAIVAAVLTGVCILTLRPALASSSWSGWRRTRHVLVVVVAIITAYVLFHMNALGYHYF